MNRITLTVVALSAMLSGVGCKSNSNTETSAAPAAPVQTTSSAAPMTTSQPAATASTPVTATPSAATAAAGNGTEAGKVMTNQERNDTTIKNSATPTDTTKK